MKKISTVFTLILLFMYQGLYAQSGLQILSVTSMPVPANAAITINGTGFSDDLNQISVRIGPGNLCKAIKLSGAGDGTQNLLVQMGPQAAYDYVYVTQGGLVSMSPSRVNVVSGCNQTTNISSAGFSPPVVISGVVADAVTQVAMGDMDNDGQMDIVSVHKGISFTYQKIDMKFATGNQIEFPTAGEVTSMELADMDGDGNLDILTNEVIYHADTTAEDTILIVVYQSVDPSNWMSKMTLKIGSAEHKNEWPARVAPIDLDHDGKLDIVYVNARNVMALDGGTTLVNDDPLHQQGEIRVFKNDWPDKFIEESADFLTHASDSLVEPGDTSMTIESVELAIGDVNGDGLPDLICEDAVNSKGTGAQRTAAVVQVAYIPPCSGPSCFDVALAIKGKVKNILGDGFGRQMAVGDIDGDGHDDIVLCLRDSAVIFSGTMIDCNCAAAAFTIDLAAFVNEEGETAACAMADINSDGKLDIAFMKRDEDAKMKELSWQNASRPGTMAGNLISENNWEAPDDLVDFAAADMNADGRPDMIFARPEMNAAISMAKNIQTCSDVTPPTCNNLCYAAGNNIVTNGNFNTKAANQMYTPSTTFTAAAFADQTAAGTYVIGPDAAAEMAKWCGTDHSSGSGNMMMVNGFKTSKTSAWGWEVPVLANTIYTFSAYVNNLTCPPNNFIDPKIEMHVDGAMIGITYTIKEKPDGWIQVSGNWLSGTTDGTATIEIVDTAAGNNGNDFAIDDVQFYGCMPSIIVDAGPDAAICNGSSAELRAKLKFGSKDGIDVLNRGTILWSPPTGLSATDIPNPVASPTETTTYTIMYTAANGMCAQSDQVTVTVNENPVATITASGPVTNKCPGKTVTLTAAAATTYLWSTGATTQSIVVSTAGSYTVMVSNASGCTATSAATVVTYRTCGKPAALTTSNITATSARLSWMAVTCAVGYQYELRKKGTATWTTAQTNTISRTITGLAPGTTYQWRVLTACQISPDTITSPGYAVGPEFTTVAGAFSTKVSGTDEIKKVSALQANLYPNPTKNIAFISISNAQGKVQVILSDVSGKQLWQTGKTSSTNISIPIQNLAQGTYMVMVKDDKESVVVKMVKE